MSEDASRSTSVKNFPVGPSSTYTGPVSSSVTVSGPTLDGYGFLPLWHGPVSLVGTAGISYLDGNAKIAAGNISTSGSKSEFGWRAGGGIEWSIGDRFSVSIIGRYQSASFREIANNALVANAGFNFYF